MCNLNTRSDGLEVTSSVNSVVVFPEGLLLTDSSTCHPLSVFKNPYWKLCPSLLAITT